ncbi:MAG: hypothetical protein OXD29_07055 [Roseovarius sp.]|nr:hypothetical protein [Roseovarius sp.]
MSESIRPQFKTVIARLEDTDQELEFNQGTGWFNLDNGTDLGGIVEGTNIVEIRHRGNLQKMFRLLLQDNPNGSWNTVKMWWRGWNIRSATGIVNREYRETYRAAPTGAIRVMFDRDGPGC